MRQTLGSAPIPPPGAPTHAPDARDLDTARTKLDADLGHAAATTEDARARITEAHRAWDEAESDARYGFGVRLQHAAAQPWSPELEATLKAEWSALNLGRDWDASRREVRRGWDFGTTRL